MRTRVTTRTDAGFDPVLLTMDSDALTYLEERASVTRGGVRVRWGPVQRETTLESIELQLSPDSATNPDEEPENWVEMVIGRVRKLSELPRGWDGYGGAAPLPSIIEAAEGLFERLRNLIPTDLPAPFVCPVSGGGLQIEMTSDTKHLEIMFDSASDIIFLKEEDVGGEELTDAGELSARDLPSIRRLFSWFPSV